MWLAAIAVHGWLINSEYVSAQSRDGRHDALRIASVITTPSGSRQPFAMMVNGRAVKRALPTIFTPGSQREEKYKFASGFSNHGQMHSDCRDHHNSHHVPHGILHSHKFECKTINCHLLVHQSRFRGAECRFFTETMHPAPLKSCTAR